MTVTANGSSAYRFAGNGVVSTADNPDLYLIRGQKNIVSLIIQVVHIHSKFVNHQVVLHITQV